MADKKQWPDNILEILDGFMSEGMTIAEMAKELNLPWVRMAYTLDLFGFERPARLQKLEEPSPAPVPAGPYWAEDDPSLRGPLPPGHPVAWGAIALHGLPYGTPGG